MMQTHSEMSNILLGLNISETVYKTTKIKKDLLFVTLMKPTIRPFFFLMEVTMNYCISVNSTEFMGQFFKLNGFLSCTNSHP